MGHLLICRAIAAVFSRFPLPAGARLGYTAGVVGIASPGPSVLVGPVNGPPLARVCCGAYPILLYGRDAMRVY